MGPNSGMRLSRSTLVTAVLPFPGRLRSKLLSGARPRPRLVYITSALHQRQKIVKDSSALAFWTKRAIPAGDAVPSAFMKDMQRR
jgi:hypothetical protein